MLRVAFAGLLILVVSGSAAATASAARPFSTGVTVMDLGNQEQLGYDRIESAGASFTRVTAIWSAVAPKSEPASWDPADPADPNYDWTSTDTIIQRAAAAGLTPLVQVFSAPSWAERCKDGGGGICNPDPEQFARFSAAAAKRYNGNFEGLPRVRFWEPWNEPNLYSSFLPQYNGKKKVSPDLYRELLNRFSGAVKAVDPGNVVVAGGLAPLGGEGALSPLDFARRLLCMEGRRKPRPIRRCEQTARFDVWATNPYTSGGPTHESIAADDVQLGDLPEVSKLLKAAKASGKIRTTSKKVGFWVTEFSWDSSPPDPGGVPMGLLTRWTAEAMFRSWQAGVSNFFWLTLRDWARPDGLRYNQTIDAGLWFRGPTIADDRPKRVVKAFRFPFVAFTKPKGISVWGRTPDSEPGKVTLTYRRGKLKKRIGVIKADRNGVFSSRIRTRLGRNSRGSVTAKYSGEFSPAFSLRLVRDRYQSPFG